jgi:hypothetical protein
MLANASSVVSRISPIVFSPANFTAFRIRVGNRTISTKVSSGRSGPRSSIRRLTHLALTFSPALQAGGWLLCLARLVTFMTFSLFSRTRVHSPAPAPIVPSACGDCADNYHEEKHDAPPSIHFATLALAPVLPLRAHPVTSNAKINRRYHCRRAIVFVSGSQIEQTLLGKRIIRNRRQVTRRLSALFLRFFIQHRHTPVTLTQSEDTRIDGPCPTDAAGVWISRLVRSLSPSRGSGRSGAEHTGVDRSNRAQEAIISRGGPE